MSFSSRTNFFNIELINLSINQSKKDFEMQNN